MSCGRPYVVQQGAELARDGLGALHLGDVTDLGEHDHTGTLEDTTGTPRHPRVDEPVVAAVDQKVGAVTRPAYRHSERRM